MITKYNIAILKVIRDNTVLSEAGYFWSSARFVSTALFVDHEISLLPESVSRYIQHLRAERYLEGFAGPGAIPASSYPNPPVNLKITDRGIEYLRVIDV